MPIPFFTYLSAIVFSLSFVCVQAQDAYNLFSDKRTPKSVRLLGEKFLLFRDGSKSFYLSKFEVSNDEYNAFINYTLDSLVRMYLGFPYINEDSSLNEQKLIPREVFRDLDDSIPELTLIPDERIFGRAEIDPDKLVYGFISNGTTYTVPVMADTLSWLRDMAYSYNEPLTKRYRVHPAFAKYPAVGISFLQAEAYCNWRTGQLNRRLAESGSPYRVIVDLPSEHEWELAALQDNQPDLSGIVTAMPHKQWFNFYFQRNDSSGETNVFDYSIKNRYFTELTKTVDSPMPPGLRLHHMIGNVSEWTSSSVDDLRPDVKIIKGGNWLEPHYLASPNVDEYAHKEGSYSFVGFRVVLRVYLAK